MRSNKADCLGARFALLLSARVIPSDAYHNELDKSDNVEDSGAANSHQPVEHFIMQQTDSSPQDANGKPVSEAVALVQVPQGAEVLFWGIFGVVLAILPTLLLLPGAPRLHAPWSTIAPILWACFVGWPATYYWSGALHKRIAVLRNELDKVNSLLPEEKKQYPGRVPWMPAWIGLFERAFYAALIGLGVEGAAGFIGVWIGFKLAGGWQVWSKGTTYGRAIFFSGLLGNAMSIAFGFVGGFVIRALNC